MKALFDGRPVVLNSEIYMADQVSVALIWMVRMEGRTWKSWESMISDLTFELPFGLRFLKKSHIEVIVEGKHAATPTPIILFDDDIEKRLTDSLTNTSYAMFQKGHLLQVVFHIG